MEIDAIFFSFKTLFFLCLKLRFSTVHVKWRHNQYSSTPWKVSAQLGEYISTISLFEMAIFQMMGNPYFVVISTKTIQIIWYCANIKLKCLKFSFANKIYVIRQILNASKHIEICTCGVNRGSLRQIKRSHH